MHIAPTINKMLSFCLEIMQSFTEQKYYDILLFAWHKIMLILQEIVLVLQGKGYHSKAIHVQEFCQSAKIFRL